MITLRLNRSVLFLLALTTAVYLISLQNGFVWDDWKLLVYNEAYRTPDLKRIFFTKANGLEYLPVRDLTLSLDVLLWGMNPFGFHLTNFLLYLAGILVVLRALKALVKVLGVREAEFASFWGTLIFALHPLHAEAVNGIAYRNTLLSALFLFLALALCIEGLQKKRDGLIVLSLAAFIISLFSKVSGIFFPFFLAIVFLLMPAKVCSVRKMSLVLLISLTVAAAAAFVHFRIAGESGMMNEGFIRYGVNNTALLIAKAVQVPFFYLKLLVVPYRLTVLYPDSFLSAGYGLRAGAAAVGAIAAFGGAFLLRKRHPLILVAISWYFLSLVPVLNIFPTEPVLADRYAYFAVFGFGILGAYFLRGLMAKSKLFLYPACAVIVLWGAVDLNRTKDWKDDLSLWKSAVSVMPGITRIELANALWARGRYEEALANLKDEYDRDGTFQYSHFMGKYFFQAGRYEDAILFFRKAAAEGGDASKEIHLELAAAYEKLGAWAPALEHYLKGTEIREANPMGVSDRTAREGLERMRAHFMPQLSNLRLRAMKEPWNFDAQSGVALYYHTLGMYEEAEAFYLKSLELDPSNWQGWYNLGLARSKLQRYAPAIDSFERSLLANPGNKDALNNIGISYMALRDYKRAVEYYQKALKLDPNFFYAAFNLGRVYFVAGDGERSKKYFSMAKAMVSGNIELVAAVDRYLRQME